MFGRRKTVKKLEETSHLEPVENPESISEIVEAVEEIAIERIRNPHTKSIETLERVHGNLDNEEAKQAYIRDETLLRRVNAAPRLGKIVWFGKFYLS